MEWWVSLIARISIDTLNYYWTRKLVYPLKIPGECKSHTKY
jgi:hypothetical protein